MPGVDPYEALLAESTYDEARKEWTHNNCGTILQAARVHHPIHDGLFPLSGNGEVRTVTVPYCPSCQQVPSPNGAPITVRSPW